MKYTPLLHLSAKEITELTAAFELRIKKHLCSFKKYNIKYDNSDTAIAETMFFEGAIHAVKLIAARNKQEQDAS